MPRNKDLKRLVRARMTKTGEAYTAARAQITKKPKAGTKTAVADAVRVGAVSAKSKDYAALAGMREARAGGTARRCAF